jgi:hypothetical protein
LFNGKSNYCCFFAFRSRFSTTKVKCSKKVAGLRDATAGKKAYKMLPVKKLANLPARLPDFGR